MNFKEWWDTYDRPKSLHEMTVREDAWNAAIAEMRKPMLCGHPAACVGGDVTMYCSWCAANVVASFREMEDK